MLVAVAGGNLQGVEVAYLARKAGWDVLVVDKNPEAPASGMCHWFVHQDLREEQHLGALFAKADLLIPALENDAALASLARCARTNDIPFAFDPAAYAVSSSKQTSDSLFVRSGIPVPLSWPDCSLPVIVKPSRASGSEDISIFHDREAVDNFLKQSQGEWVAQAYMQGPTYSLEVLGRNGDYLLPQVTDLHMDEQYDCRAVTAPTLLAPELVAVFEKLSLEIAQLIDLNGLMDVDVVVSDGELRVGNDLRLVRGRENTDGCKLEVGGDLLIGGLLDVDGSVVAKGSFAVGGERRISGTIVSGDQRPANTQPTE